MNALDLLGEFYRLGVTLVISGGQIRARAPQDVLTLSLFRLLAEHKESIIDLLGEGTFPYTTPPDEFHIPASVPNTVEAIQACLDGQRRKVV